MWVPLLSIFIYRIDAAFPTLGPTSHCEWVFHSAILSKYSLQGIHMKLVAPPMSFSVLINMNWTFICYYACVNICRCFIISMLTALKKTPNRQHLKFSYIYLFSSLYLLIFFQLLSVSVCHFGVGKPLSLALDSVMLFAPDSFCITVLGWPWLDVRCPPKPVYHFPLQLDEGEQILQRVHELR